MFGTSSNPVVDIGIAMTLQDRFSGPAGNIASNWERMMSDLGSISRGIKMAYQDSLDRSLGIMKTLANTFGYSAQVHKNTFLTNKMIGDSVDHQKELLEQAKEINLRNPLKLWDITSAQKFMAMAGMGFKEIQKAAEPAAQMASIFSMPAGEKGGTADLLTNIMATFQLGAGEAQSAGDQLSVAATSANMSLTDLAQSVKYAGANAKMAGLDMSELISAIGVLGNYGIQGSMAGTNFGRALLTFNKAITGTKRDGVNALKSLGLSPKDFIDAQGNLVNLHEALKKIADAEKASGGIMKQHIQFALFGQQGARAMHALIEDINSGVNNYEKILEKVQNSSGWLASTTREYMDSPQGRIDQMISAWDNLKLTIGDAASRVFVPALGLINSILKSINKFITNDIGSAIAKWGVSAMIVGTAFKMVRTSLSMGSTLMSLLTTNTTKTATAANAVGAGMRGAATATAAMNAQLRMSLMLMAQMAVIQQGGQMISPFQGSKVRIGMGRGKDRGPVFWRETKQGGWAKIDPAVAERYFQRYFGFGLGGLLGGSTGEKGGTAESFMGRILTKTLGQRFGTIVTSGLGKIGTGMGVAARFLGGPWGLAIGTAASFILPKILEAITGNNKEPSEEDLEAKRQAERDRFMEDFLKGKPATITLNVNGRKVGTFSDGDTTTIDDPNRSAIDWGID